MHKIRDALIYADASYWRFIVQNITITTFQQQIFTSSVSFLDGQ